MNEKYDLIVIGAGMAGVAAANKCGAAGWRVAIVDALPYGGTCALRGCDPKKILRRGAEIVDAARLLEIAADRDVVGLVLGLPLNMDGSEGPRAQATRAFARNLGGLTDLPVAFWDERLSTVAAERALLEADTSRKKRGEVIDHVAAAFILQGVLDRLRFLESNT